MVNQSVIVKVGYSFAFMDLALVVVALTEPFSGE